MGETKKLPAGFAAAVLAWLNEEFPEGRRELRHDPAVELTHCSMYGTDWAGDTEGGFYSEHDLTLMWVTASGLPGTLEVRGEAMESLWHAVVAAWPDDEPMRSEPETTDGSTLREHVQRAHKIRTADKTLLEVQEAHYTEHHNERYVYTHAFTDYVLASQEAESGGH